MKLSTTLTSNQWHESTGSQALSKPRQTSTMISKV